MHRESVISSLGKLNDAFTAICARACLLRAASNGQCLAGAMGAVVIWGIGLTLKNKESNLNAFSLRFTFRLACRILKYWRANRIILHCLPSSAAAVADNIRPPAASMSTSLPNFSVNEYGLD